MTQNEANAHALTRSCRRSKKASKRSSRSLRSPNCRRRSISRRLKPAKPRLATVFALLDLRNSYQIKDAHRPVRSTAFAVAFVLLCCGTSPRFRGFGRKRVRLLRLLCSSRDVSTSIVYALAWPRRSRRKARKERRRSPPSRRNQ